MNIIQDWSGILSESLGGLLEGFLDFIPKLIGAIIVFVIGWIIAVWVGKFIAEILKRLKFDKIFEKTQWEEALEKAEFKMSMSGFIGSIVKWILAVVFIGSAIKILGLNQFDGFVNGIVGWLPNLVVAAAIFVVAVIMADFAEKLIKAIIGKMNVGHVNLVGAIVKWSIWIFAAFAILAQLAVGAAGEIIQILITGFVALIVISGALAFGLGGKDIATDILQKFRNRIKE